MTRRFAVSIIAAAFLVAGIAPAAVAELRFESEITWSVELEEGLLHVESEVRITNLKRNRDTGYQIIRYYYDQIAIYVPDTAIEFRAFRGDTELNVTLEPPEDPEAEGLLEATIHLPKRLFYKQSMDLFIEYDIPGDEPRSDSLFRVNPAYISFGAYGWGDPGLTTVTVRVPGHFDLEVSGADLVETGSTGLENVYTVTGIEDPTNFFMYIVGRDDDQLTIDKADLDEADVFVRGWPGDDEWVAKVLEYVEKGLPVLQELIGQDWAPGTYLQILESGDVAHSGYGGWYLQDNEIIEVHEWAGPHLVLHELSHTWFNGDLFEERWITEGLADEFAFQAAVEAGLDLTDEVRLSRPPARNTEVETLNQWKNLFGVPESQRPDDIEAYEAYGYEASFWVVQALVEEIGIEAMAHVINAAAEDLIAYQGDSDPETVDPEDDWRRFLDLLEEIGGSKNATDLFERWVTDKDLTGRTESRDAYHQLVADGDGWGAPFYVRNALSDWDFEEVAPRIDAARAVLHTKGVLISNYVEVGIEMPSSLEDAYESATESMDDAQALADHHVEATERVIEAQDKASLQRDFVDQVGLIGEDIPAELLDVMTAMESEALDEAIAESDELLALLAGADEEGAKRLGYAGGGLFVILSGVVILVVRRRRSAAGVAEETPAA